MDDYKKKSYSDWTTMYLIFLNLNYPAGMPNNLHLYTLIWFVGPNLRLKAALACLCRDCWALLLDLAKIMLSNQIRLYINFTLDWFVMAKTIHGGDYCD